jgi:hypothetical protein
LGFTVLPMLACALGQLMLMLSSGTNSSIMAGIICASLSLPQIYQSRSERYSAELQLLTLRQDHIG